MNPKRTMKRIGTVLAIGAVFVGGALQLTSDAGYAGVGPNALPWLVSVVLMGANPVSYIDRTFQYMDLNDLFSGLVKAGAFGFLLAVIGWTARAGLPPVSIIFDSDVDHDCDDIGALFVLHGAVERGEARLLATIGCTSSEAIAPCLDAINTWFGRPEIPVGTLKDPGFLDHQGFAAEILRRKLARGNRVVGLKAGLTSRGKMKQMGVDTPVFGWLVDYFSVPDGGEIKTSELIHPKVEPEIVFVTKRALKGPGCHIGAVLYCEGLRGRTGIRP